MVHRSLGETPNLTRGDGRILRSGRGIVSRPCNCTSFFFYVGLNQDSVVALSFLLGEIISEGEFLEM